MIILLSVYHMEHTDCLLHTAWIDQNPTLQITPVGDRDVAQRTNTTFEAAVHTEDLVFTGEEAGVGHRVLTPYTGDGKF